MRFLVPLLLFATACSSAGASIEAQSDSPGDAPISISMSLYVVDSADGGPGALLSSRRSLPNIDVIAERVQSIWEQAGVELVVETIARIEVPEDVLLGLRNGDTTGFVTAARSGAVAIPGPATINGFYVSHIGTANGMTPFDTRLFFVADEPSVPDERVSSHEIGHILGLHHVLDDSSRLMFSGTDGTALTNPEIAVARYAAIGILNGVR